MKKLIALLLVLTMAVALVACGKDEKVATEPTAEVMTYADFMAAETDALVCVESYVQAHQAWWFDDEAGHGKVTIYLQDAEGAYFAYEVNCTEEVAAQLVAGTKVRVSGEKAVWSGEVEIMNATLEVIEGADSYVAEAKDVTALLGTEELINHQNELVSFTGLTIEAIEYKNGEPGDDIYVTVGYNGASYSFCVERYLTDPSTAVYAAVGELEVGDVVNVEGFLYWYEGVNTHITSVEVVE